MSKSKPHIAIVGGGIGGLNAALHLLQAGFEVEIFEQTPAKTEVESLGKMRNTFVAEKA